MSLNVPRNVNFYNGVTGDLLGGVYQSGSITNANFFHMLMDILLVLDGIPTIRHRQTGQSMPLNTNRLAIGDYDIFPARGGIEVNQEALVRRVISRSGRSREQSFRNAVRARDQKCVLTGTQPINNNWASFEAAHVFPLVRRTLWRQCGYSNLITLPGQNPMNSVQNGLLMLSNIHQRFDKFEISINPDDGYKITDFSGNLFGVDGRILDRACRDHNNPRHVPNELLRWHFRQAVLANMRGAGEPTFEHDFPPGTDMVREILEGPFPAEHMELELFSRLPAMSSEGEESVY